jgi:hypothetical protein
VIIVLLSNNSESKTRNQQRDYYEKKEEMALKLQEQKQLEAMRLADCNTLILPCHHRSLTYSLIYPCCGIAKRAALVEAQFREEFARDRRNYEALISQLTSKLEAKTKEAETLYDEKRKTEDEVARQVHEHRRMKLRLRAAIRHEHSMRVTTSPSQVHDSAAYL